MEITLDHIEEMVEHWLNTPINSFVGSNYGSDVNTRLQLAQGDVLAEEEFLEKLMTDVPLLSGLDARVLVGENSIDVMSVSIAFAGRVVSLPDYRS